MAAGLSAFYGLYELLDSDNEEEVETEPQRDDLVIGDRTLISGDDTYTGGGNAEAVRGAIVIGGGDLCSGCSCAPPADPAAVDEPSVVEAPLV